MYQSSFVRDWWNSSVRKGWIVAVRVSGWNEGREGGGWKCESVMLFELNFPKVGPIHNDAPRKYKFEILMAFLIVLRPPAPPPRSRWSPPKSTKGARTRAQLNKSAPAHRAHKENCIVISEWRLFPEDFPFGCTYLYAHIHTHTHTYECTNLAWVSLFNGRDV